MHKSSVRVEEAVEGNSEGYGAVKAVLSLVLSTASSAALNTNRIPKRIGETCWELFTEGFVSFTGLYICSIQAWYLFALYLYLEVSVHIMFV
jgi:hypothetical protein